MKSFKKYLAVAMVFAILFSAALSGCGNGGANTGTNDKTEKAGDAKQGEQEQQLKEVKLTWYFPGNWPQPEQDLVFKEVNKTISEKINATVNFVPVISAEYDQKMQIIITSAEKYDLCFTANWKNNYVQNVSKGAFLPLDDLLAKYAPKTFSRVSKDFWNAARINGKIYGFINEQISARTPNVAISKAHVEKYRIDMSSLSGKIGPDSLNLLEPIIEAIRKDEPQRGFYTNFSQLGGEFFGYELINGWKCPGAVQYTDTGIKVVNQYETQAYRTYARVMREWNAKGYLNAKERIAKPDSNDDGKAGKYAISMGGTYKPGGEILDSNNTGYPLLEVPSGTPYLTTGGIIATMHAISRNSENPERAMMFLELINTDQALYNTLNFGIKDKHWQFDGDGFMVKQGDAAKAYMPNVPWMFATNYLAYVEKGMPKTVWEDTKKINATAKVSNLLGFNFSPDNVKGEIGKCSAVIDEYSRAIELGVATEANYNEFLAKLKTAGADKIVAEMQTQIDAWKKTK